MNNLPYSFSTTAIYSSQDPEAKQKYMLELRKHAGVVIVKALEERSGRVSIEWEDLPRDPLNNNLRLTVRIYYE